MVKEVKSKLLNTDKFIGSRNEDTGEVLYGVLGKDLEAFVIDQQGDFVDEYGVIVDDLSNRNVNNQDNFRDLRLDHEAHYAQQKEELRLERRKIENNYDGRNTEDISNLITNSLTIQELKNLARITKVFHSIPEETPTSEWSRGHCTLVSETDKYEDVSKIIFHRHDILSQEPAKFWGLFPGDTIDISVYKNEVTPIYDTDENGAIIKDDNGDDVVIKEVMEKKIITRSVFSVKTGDDAFNPLETDGDEPLISVPVTFVNGNKGDIVISGDPTTDDNLYLNLDDYAYYQINVIPSLDLSQLVRIRTILNDIDAAVPIGSIFAYLHNGTQPNDSKLPGPEYGIWKWLTPPGGNLDLPDATTYPEFNEFMKDVKNGSSQLTKLPDFRGRYIIGHQGTLNYNLNNVITKQTTSKPSSFKINDNGDHLHTVTIDNNGEHFHKVGSTSIADTTGTIKVYGSCKMSGGDDYASDFSDPKDHRHTATISSHTDKHKHTFTGFNNYHRMNSYVTSYIIKVDHGTDYKRLESLIP